MKGKRLTNREILELLLADKQQEKEDYKLLAQNQGNLSGQMSSLANKLDESNAKFAEQELVNQKILNLLQDNPDTGQKGAISTLSDQGERIQKLETKDKVTAGKVAFATFLIITLGGFFISVLTFFENIFGN